MKFQLSTIASVAAFLATIAEASPINSSSSVERRAVETARAVVGSAIERRDITSSTIECRGEPTTVDRRDASSSNVERRAESTSFERRAETTPIERRAASSTLERRAESTSVERRAETTPITINSNVEVSPIERRAVKAVTGWEYQGCRTDAVKARALTGSFYFDDKMTVDKCAIACNKFTYFGVEFGQECFCGNTLTNNPAVAPESECSYKCEGALDQSCGAAPRINLYKKSTTVATAAPVVPKYTSQGCYTDNTNNRALKGAVNFDFSASMSRDKCAAICTGWGYFGVEFGRECFCGDKLTTGTFVASTSECNIPCAGLTSTLCGGSSRLNVFHYTDASS